MAIDIEDTQIAAVIDDLKRRWPTIGVAADHPLTEWFIRNRRKIKTNGSPAFTFSRRRKRKNLGRPFCLLANMGDVEQWTQFAVVPLEYSSIAGVIAGYEYFRYKKSLRIQKIVLSLLAVIICFLIVIAAWFDPDVSYRTRGWNFVPWAAILIGLVFVMFSFGRIIFSNVFLLSFIFRQMNTSLKQHQGMSIGPLCRDVYVIPMTVFAVSLVSVAFVFDVGHPMMCIPLLAGSTLFNLVFAYYDSKRDLNRMFLRIVERESAKYPDYVRAIIQSK